MKTSILLLIIFFLFGYGSNQEINSDQKNTSGTTKGTTTGTTTETLSNIVIPESFKFKTLQEVQVQISVLMEPY